MAEVKLATVFLGDVQFFTRSWLATTKQGVNLLFARVLDQLNFDDASKCQVIHFAHVKYLKGKMSACLNTD